MSAATANLMHQRKQFRVKLKIHFSNQKPHKRWRHKMEENALLLFFSVDTKANSRRRQCSNKNVINNNYRALGQCEQIA